MSNSVFIFFIYTTMKKKGAFFLLLIISIFYASSFSVYAIPDYYDLKVDIEFCNPTEKHLDIVDVIPEKQIDICISVKNLNAEEKFLRMYFVDGFVDEVSSNYIVCKNREDEREGFSRFSKFTRNREENVFTLSPDGVIQFTAFAKVSKDYAGALYWCLVTEKVDQDLKDGTININVRKANTIKLDVKWDLKLWLNTTLNKKVTVQADKALTVEAVTRNKDSVLSYLGSVISPYIEASEDFIQWETIELNSAKEEEKEKISDRSYIWKEKIIFQSENLEIIQKGSNNNFYIKRKLENIGAIPLEVKVRSDISNSLWTIFTAKQEVVVQPFKTLILNTDIGSFPEYNTWDFKLNNVVEYIPVSSNKKLTTPFVKKEEVDFFVFQVKVFAYLAAFTLFVWFLLLLIVKEFIIFRIRKARSLGKGKRIPIKRASPRKTPVKRVVKKTSTSQKTKPVKKEEAKKKPIKKAETKTQTVKKTQVKKTAAKKAPAKKKVVKKSTK